MSASPPPPPRSWSRSLEAEEKKRRLAAHCDAVDRDLWKRRNRYYHGSVESLCRRLVPRGSRVLELGCSTGDLLAALEPDPAASLGIDLSPRTIERAKAKYPALSFAVGDAENLALSPGTSFDHLVMSDVVGHLQDLYATFRGLHAISHERTRLVLTFYNFLWEGVLRLAERLGWKMPQGYQNWLGMWDVENLLRLSDFHVVERGWELLLPKRVPLLSDLLNRLAPRIPGLRQLCLVQYIVAEIRPTERASGSLAVSVIVPTRNEVGNVDEAVETIPEMGRHTEIVFVDGASTDGTVARIEAAIERHRGRKDIRLIHQVPEGDPASEDPHRMLALGKGDAVRKGFEAATGDVLMILDADLTVPPEDLPRFVEVLAEGKARFVNGTRLVYAMEDESMRFLNLCGNKAFSLAFSWLLGQRLKDTLCGTKALFRSDYGRIRANRAYFGELDPFGDFDLLFGAARLGLPIVDLPVRYARRVSGVSKVRLVSHGWLLLRMTWVGFRKFKLNRWLGREEPLRPEPRPPSNPP